MMKACLRWLVASTAVTVTLGQGSNLLFLQSFLEEVFRSSLAVDRKSLQELAELGPPRVWSVSTVATSSLSRF